MDQHTSEVTSRPHPSLVTRLKNGTKFYATKQEPLRYVNGRHYGGAIHGMYLDYAGEYIKDIWDRDGHYDPRAPDLDLDWDSAKVDDAPS